MLVYGRAKMLCDCMMTGDTEMDWDWSEIDNLVAGNTDAGLDKTWSEGRMYAIAFDLDCSACKRHYPGSDWRHSYRDIQTVLNEHGFWNQQGSVYYSHHGRTVQVVKAVMALQERFSWFRNVVHDLRMLRIEENDDLKPLLGQPELPLGKKPPTRQPRPNELKLN